MLELDLTVLHEDNHTIVVYKPSDVPMQPDSSNTLSLYDMVKIYLKQKYQKQGNVFVGIVQRLDRPVSGLVLLAKTSKGASRLSEQIRERTILKYYQAVVLGVPNIKTATLNDSLSWHQERCIVTKDGKKSSLTYTVLKHSHHKALLEILLHTGRKHQIRCQLANIGHPIVGDLRYGKPQPLTKQPIALRAQRVIFNHPTTKEIIDITLPHTYDLAGEYLN